MRQDAHSVHLIWKIHTETLNLGKMYTIVDFKKGDKIKLLSGEILEVRECGMIEYPAPLLDCVPVPAIITTDGRYFNLALSGIEKIET
jgi:hypothetical protein